MMEFFNFPQFAVENKRIQNKSNTIERILSYLNKNIIEFSLQVENKNFQEKIQRGDGYLAIYEIFSSTVQKLLF